MTMNMSERHWTPCLKNHMNKPVNIAIVISVILFFVEGATDVFMPNLADIARDLSTTDYASQLLVSLDFLGLGISGLIYGPLSGIYGRRPIMLISMIIFFLASVICSVSADIYTLMISRFFVGVGGGAAPTVGMAMIHDVYTKKEKIKHLANLQIITGLAPAFMPVIGGIVGLYYHWRYTFYLISMTSLLGAALTYAYLNETIKEKNVSHKSIKKTFYSVMQEYWVVLRDREFICIILMISLIIGPMFAETANIPFILEQTFNLPGQYYGYLMFILLVIYIIGNKISQQLSTRYGIEAVITTGIIILIIPSSIISTMSHTCGIDIIPLISLKLLMPIGYAFLYGNLINKTLSIEIEHKGITSSKDNDRSKDLTGAKTSLYHTAEILAIVLGIKLASFFHGLNMIAIIYAIVAISAIMALVISQRSRKSI